MSILESLSQEPGTSTMATGVVVRSEESIIVVADDDPKEIECSVLQLGERQTGQPAVGDAVLIWRASAETRLGIILGRIGPGHAPRLKTDVMPENAEHSVPDELVIEARQSITLRVGDGSITIREDGKILIKGKDLVSHAKRLNRIRGGSVQIN